MQCSGFKLASSQSEKKQRLRTLAAEQRKLLLTQLATAWERHYLLPTVEAKRRQHLSQLEQIESHVSTIFPDLIEMITKQRHLRNPKTLTATQRAQGLQMLVDLRQEIERT